MISHFLDVLPFINIHQAALV